MSRPRDYGAEVEQSGEAFNLGDLRVAMTCGYSEDGNWLRFLIIRAWPLTSTVEERVNDPRYDSNSGGRPKVRHPDGVMRKVGTDGHVYLFVGDELRTMRANMNEHTDTVGLCRAGSLDGMWAYLQQFRVPDTTG